MNKYEARSASTRAVYCSYQQQSRPLDCLKILTTALCGHGHLGRPVSGINIHMCCLFIRLINVDML